MKRIGKARRGLTFTVDPDTVKIGQKYRYIVNKANHEVLITLADDGKNSVSRKLSGSKYKPLFDLRSKEVKELVGISDYFEIEIRGKKIIVHCIAEVANKELHLVKSNVVDLAEILNGEVGTIELKVSGRNSIPAELVNRIPSNVYNAERANSQKVYDVVSLFSGAGLLDYAFRDNQFCFVYGVDFDKDDCATYKENIGDHIHCKDIRTVEANEIPNCNVVIGGPCCQAYSNANRRNEYTEVGEQKRLLIDDFCRLTKAKNPDVFVIENVPQLLTKENGKYIQRVFDQLDDWEITTAVVNDSEVGGYSTRKRAIVIGSKIGRIKIPNVKTLTVKTVRDALVKVNAEWFNYNDVTEPRESTVEAMQVIPQGGNWECAPDSIKAKHGWHKGRTQSNVFRRLSWNKPSPTITNWRKAVLIHPEENRILSVSEAAAIMGLDKGFKVYGSTLNSRQQQVCNGVTQAIGGFVKNLVKSALNKNYGVVMA